MSTKKPNTFDRNDDFWDIDEMLPKKRFGAVFSTDTDASEIDIEVHTAERKGQAIPKINAKVSLNLKNAQDVLSKVENMMPKISSEVSERLKVAREALAKAEETHLRYTSSAFGDRKTSDRRNFDETKPSDEPLFTYVPNTNPLIKEVTVRLWPARYSFYEKFRKDAEKYYGIDGSPCAYVPFFSFTPQYSQLTDEQLDFYFYFRTSVRNGQPIKADYSYILLLIYEIINIPDILPPENGLELLCLIWRSYRRSHSKLDRHLSEWICDYCLIHRLESDMLKEVPVSEAIRGCSLKEFYVGLDDNSSSPFAAALFAHASVYDYRNSKFINNENRKLFDTHIKGAFIYAFTKAEKEHQTIFAPIGQKSMIPLKMVRDAYNGALCAYNVKRRIEVSYLSCSRSVELRYAVTDTIKFAENQVRAMLGIRSRFHTPNLAHPLRNAVEEYFLPFKKVQKKEAKEKEVPEYDSLYEPVKNELSLDYAMDIERASWATTELLTDGLEKYTEVAEADEGIVFEETTEKPLPTQNKTSNDDESWISKALSLAIENNNAGFEALSHSLGMLPDALCEAVNDRLYDTVGDIVIENVEGKYQVIVDYLEEINEWMKK